jgi:thioesterase domain-containing protein
MGGVVAFEMARRLTSLGESVSLLALIDSYVASSRPGESPEPLLRVFAQDMADLLGLDPEGEGWQDGLDSEESLLSGLIAKGQRQGVFPADLSSADLRDVFLAFKRNHEAWHGYVAGPYGGRVELLRAQAGLGELADPTAGWGGLAAGGVGVHVLPGDHYSLLKAPHVASLASWLRASMEVATPAPIGDKR